MPTHTDLGQLYRESRQRIVELVGTLSPAEAATPVPACPGWNVHDVVAHMTATTEDALAGRLTGPPTDEWTAEQVERHRDDTIADLLGIWSELGPQFDEVISGFKVWPGVIDAVSHEHDIRGALSRPGDRDSAGVRESAEAVLGWFEPPVPIVVHLEDTTIGLGPSGGSPLELTTTRFEAIRFRMGRRSRAQLAAMEWKGDPSPVLDTLVVFGPARSDVVE
jgi:uncharacterized protein (TIGR03083 family)